VGPFCGPPAAAARAAFALRASASQAATANRHRDRITTTTHTSSDRTATCGARRPVASGTRTHAVTCALLTSSAPTRSNTVSTAHLLRDANHDRVARRAFEAGESDERAQWRQSGTPGKALAPNSERARGHQFAAASTGDPRSIAHFTSSANGRRPETLRSTRRSERRSTAPNVSPQAWIVPAGDRAVAGSTPVSPIRFSLQSAEIALQVRGRRDPILDPVRHPEPGEVTPGHVGEVRA